MTSQPLPRDFAANLDSSIERHRAFVKAALTELVSLQPNALNRDGSLYAIWLGNASSPAPAPGVPHPVSPPPATAARQLVTLTQATAVFGRPPTPEQLTDLNGCLLQFSITTPARIRHFLAQIGHESGGLRWMQELADGSAYEGRTDLGNTQPGDGVRFKGVGPIQVTGRYNYQRFADFIGDPAVMQGCPYVAGKYPFSISGFWWHLNALNSFIDNGASCRQVSAKVNGRDPANGLADREAYYAKAMQAIPTTQVAPAPAAPARLDPRGAEEEGLLGPKIGAPVKPGDSYLLVNNRDRDLEAYDHTGAFLWRIPCLATGQHANWRQTNGNTPPGLYRIGQIYRDYEENPNPPQSDTAMSYGWYSFDLVELENQEAVNGRAGIMLHSGGSACGWPGAWAERQALHPTLGCIRIHNIDGRDKVLPLCKKGTVYVGVFQQVS